MAAGLVLGGRKMPAPMDSQDLRAETKAPANESDQPTAAERRICDLLSSTSARREQLLLWIAKSIARSLVQGAKQPMKGQDQC
jgi:hypothetical protein